MRINPFFRMSFSKCLIFLWIGISTLLLSCTTKNEVETKDELEDYYEFQGFDLSDYELSATIMLPDETADIGASTRPEVVHKESDFFWDIFVGPSFQLHIEDYGDNVLLIEKQKSKLANYSFYDIKYLLDEKDLIVYEQKLKVRGNVNAPNTVGVEHVSYHVYGIRNINGVNYELRSSDEGVEKSIIDLMAKSIRSFKQKTNS